MSEIIFGLNLLKTAADVLNKAVKKYVFGFKKLLKVCKIMFKY